VREDVPEANCTDNDISAILAAWEHKPGEVVVRRVAGVDGRPKIQMRLDLGLLQMELDGRPDGQRPHGEESLLEYYLAEIEKHKAEFDTDAGFGLDSGDCHLLQEEGLQYYQRYVSLLALGDFARAERDTGRNLRVFDLVWKHAVRESDKWALERHRPYVMMMNARARAAASLGDGKRDRAVSHIKEGVARIERFFASHDQGKLSDASPELAFLKAWLLEVTGAGPAEESDTLRDELEWAVDIEDYERAARIRDRMRRLGMSSD